MQQAMLAQQQQQQQQAGAAAAMGAGAAGGAGTAGGAAAQQQDYQSQLRAQAAYYSYMADAQHRGQQSAAAYAQPGGYMHGGAGGAGPGQQNAYGQAYAQ